MSEIISELNLNNNGARPLSVQFQNAQVLEGNVKQTKSAVFSNLDTDEISATVTIKDLLYSGKVKRNEQSITNNFLLIRNRNTGKIRVVAIDSVTLSPWFPKKHKNVDLENTTINSVNPTSDLNKQFGSKKIKRMTEQRERLEMDIENVKEQLEQTVAGIEIDENETFAPQSNENDSSYRPPINRDAATKEQVYSLNSVVPVSVLNSLEQEAIEILESDLDLMELSPFVKKCLTDLQEAPGSTAVEKCKQLLFIHYLIQFLLKPARSIATKKFVICPSSKEVNSHILDNYSVSTGTGRTRPLSMKDKIVCSILVIAMITLDYEVDVEALSKDVKLGLKKIQEISRVLAFSTHSKSKNVMILKIPLPPPVSISPKKRKR